MTNEEQSKEWVKNRPARALKVYYGGGRKDAITEMCIGCVGSAQEARICVCDDCPLFMFRPGATRGVVPAWVPSEDELEAEAEGRVSEAVREHARKLGNSRKGN